MFLPRKFWLLVFLPVWLAACGDQTRPTPAKLDAAIVVAGTGELAPAVIERVRGTVATELVGLREVFGNRDLQRFFVHVHESRASMPPNLTERLHPDSPGFAMLGAHQIHLVWGEMRRTGASIRGVVVHELVHELLDQHVAPHGRALPRWFHEGLAQLLAGDTYLHASEEDLVWRVGARRLFAFGQLANRFPSSREELRTAYAQSFSYVSWLVRQYGVSTMLRIARDADQLTSFGRALVGRTGRSTLWLEAAWRDHLLHGSGASWRVWLENSFSMLLLLALPVLVLALIRRLNSEQRAAQRLAQAERAAQARAAADAAAQATEIELGGHHGTLHETPEQTMPPEPETPRD